MTVVNHHPRLLQHPLGTGHLAGAARVRFRGHAQRPSKDLEAGLHDVVVVAAVKLADVQGEATVVHHGYEEFPHKLGVVAADALGTQLQVKGEISTGEDPD